MKARGIIEAELSKVTSDVGGWTCFDSADALIAALLSAPEPVRLELARALVKPEGWRVVKVPGQGIPIDAHHHYRTVLPDWPGVVTDEISNGWADGFNACRAATLASEGGE